jgi:hypothetical protein
MTRVYVKDGKAFAVCPESGTDQNVWVWCAQCAQYWNCFGDKWLSDVIRDAELQDEVV